MQPFKSIHTGQPLVVGWAVREKTYIYLWPIHVDIWQKPTLYCKAIIFQVKINKFKLKNKKTHIVCWGECSGGITDRSTFVGKRIEHYFMVPFYNHLPWNSWECLAEEKDTPMSSSDSAKPEVHISQLGPFSFCIYLAYDHFPKFFRID